jgi:hypothetical protein
MFRPHSLSKLLATVELIPQAMLSGAISELAKKHGWTLEAGNDDLDAFVGVAFILPPSARAKTSGDTPFAIMHYNGHPASTATIYLPFEVQNVATITALVAKIATAFDLKRSLLWQRKDDARR